MITSEEIERAERTLMVVYQEDNVPRQLRAAEVELVDFNNWLVARTGAAAERHRIKWGQTNPVIHQAYNTLLMHFFLVGLVAGRNQETSI